MLYPKTALFPDTPAFPQYHNPIVGFFTGYGMYQSLSAFIQNTSLLRWPRKNIR